MFGRVGVISAAARRRRQESYKFGKTTQVDLSDKDLQSAENIIYQQAQITRNLVIYNVPVLVWTMGSLIILVGIYLLYNLLWGYEGKIFTDKVAKWWQYFLACMIICLGFTFILSQRREKLIFNKNDDEIIYFLRNFICQKTTFTKKVSQIQNICIVKRGIDTIQNKTIHYKMVITFYDGTRFEALETRSSHKIQEQYILIMNYLKFQFDKIQIVDESR